VQHDIDALGVFKILLSLCMLVTQNFITRPI